MRQLKYVITAPLLTIGEAPYWPKCRVSKEINYQSHYPVVPVETPPLQCSLAAKEAMNIQSYWE
jgi:hypothetical protein